MKTNNRNKELEFKLIVCEYGCKNKSAKCRKCILQKDGWYTVPMRELFLFRKTGPVADFGGRRYGKI